MANLFKLSYMPYLLVAIGLVLIFLWARSRGPMKEGFDGSTVVGASENPWRFNMYYVDWCPHCHHAKPEFEKLGSTMTIGGKKVWCQKFEYEVLQKKGGDAWNNLRANKDENPVSGFPTIRLYNSAGTKVSEYAGERTKDGFLAFLKANVQ